MRDIFTDLTAIVEKLDAQGAPPDSYVMTPTDGIYFKTFFYFIIFINSNSCVSDFRFRLTKACCAVRSTLKKSWTIITCWTKRSLIFRNIIS